MSPDEVFTTAREAMERGDLHAFFRCFDINTLNMILKNSVLLSLQTQRGTEAEFDSIYKKYSLDAAAIRDVLFDVPDGQNPELVRQYTSRLNKTIRKALKNVSDQPGLAADLEYHNRKVGGGGSISLKLFVGETLTDLDVRDDRAWGTRQVTESWSETVGFVKNNGEWYIRLIARRPRKRSG